MINIFSTIAQYKIPFTEGWEGVASLPNNNWTVLNTTNKVAWTTTTTASYSGSSSVWIDNYNCDTSLVHAFISPTLDFTTLSNPKLFYRVAYAQTDAKSNDILKVNVSKDCGVTWATRSTKSGNSLKTVPPQTAVFKPTSTSQWRLDSVTLSAYSTIKNVMIKFELTNENGNNIYIDDINIKGTPITTGIDDPLANNINFNIYPNPVQDKSIIAFNLIDRAKVTVKLIDILGKEVMNLVDGQQLASGNYKYPFSTIGMASGIYFVKLMVEDRFFVQKVLVQ